MHFEKNLRKSTYPPWKDQYIDYRKLKRLLRDDGSDAGSVAGQEDDDGWTEEDEGAFVEELVNVQLEKVHNFQVSTIQQLRDRTSSCEAKLDPIVVKEAADAPAIADDNNKTDDGKSSAILPTASRDEDVLREVSKELDSITKEINELEKFSRINYTGFLKATKKHDRRRGHAYRVRPLMQVRLAALPFNKEDYSPLLFRLSTMYNFVRQRLNPQKGNRSFSGSHVGSDEFINYKFWVHHDNILELKTNILRRLPVLVYNPQTSKIVDGSQNDPTITSIYFDNPKFPLYDAKVGHIDAASSFRLRWFGQLSENPEIFCEKKTVYDDDTSIEQKIVMKQKHVQAFLDGDYKMEKDLSRLRERFGADSDEVAEYRQTVDEIQDFIKTNNIQPMLRANYSRTAFQIPGDGRVRITLDTNVALIREDALDPERSCRDPSSWHRKDIDDVEMEFPFEKIRKGEINRFPFAILEIRIRGGKEYEWVSELMNSHLVKPAARFSKFVHGVAHLFDDYVNTFPFWLSEVDTDIRRDPQQAFEEEQERKAKAAEDEFAVGSLIKSQNRHSLSYISGGFRSPIGSPMSGSRVQRGTPERATPAMTKMTPDRKAALAETSAESKFDDSDSDGEINTTAPGGRASGLRFTSLMPSSLSTSRYARRRGQGHVKLPHGVSTPSFWIKDEGPVKVEAKVWLANQRTFIKWQHVAILLASLSLGLYNAAGEHNNIARVLAVVYTIVALFTAIWGWAIYIWRSKLIRQRSGRDFDNVLGPLIVCTGLVLALCFNFAFKYNQFLQRKEDGHKSPNISGSMTFNETAFSSDTGIFSGLRAQP